MQKREKFDLKGKKHLDVGCRTAEASYIATQKGADSYGIDPDIESLEFAHKKGFLSRDKAFGTTLQNLPQEHKGTFDIATQFLWSLAFTDKDPATKALAHSLKPDGIAVVGIHDDYYKYGDPYLESVPNLLRRHFGEVTVYDHAGGDSQQQMLCICRKPIQD